MDMAHSDRFMSVSEHLSEADREKYRLRRLENLKTGAILTALVLFAMPVVLAIMAMNTLATGPLPEATPDADKPTYVFMDEAGREIGMRGPHRRPVTLDTLSPHTIEAFIAIEDRRFFRHAGIDLVGIGRAAWANREAGRIVEGGSTITQQLVKNLYLTSEKTYDRKVEEAIYALRMERQREKTAILQDYLYTVYFGANAYGIEAAAETYFGKAASKLSVAESAMLAGVIKAPSTYNPFRREEEARRRAVLVLGTMLDQGYLTTIEHQLALYDLDHLSFIRSKAEPNGYFLDAAAKRAEELGVHRGQAPGYGSFQTTLDRPYQQIAESTIADIMTDAVKEEFNVSEAAIVAMRPNGEVIAMVGGTNYAESQFNRAVSAKRQPGSLFKAFVYEAALEKGWRPDDYIVDVPISLPIPDKTERYRPVNYDNRYFGMVTTATAFAKSANSAAMRMQEWAGRDNVIATAKRAGLDADLPPWPSLGLGVFETNLLDMTAAYASLVSNQRIEPALLKEDVQALSDGHVNTALLSLMRESVTSGTSRSTAIETASFGKTGTTQDYRDAWFIGLTDNLIVGVWVGNDDNSPMNRVTGASLPGLIWKNFMQDARPHLALEKNPPAFADRPLAEVVEEADGKSPSGTTLARHYPRILGPAKVNGDGSLNFYGRTLTLAGIDPGYFRPYTTLAQNLPSIANRREMMCEMRGRQATCEVNGHDLATMAVSRGWAAISNDAEGGLWYAESKARTDRRGIWGSGTYYPDPAGSTAYYTETAAYRGESIDVVNGNAFGEPVKYGTGARVVGHAAVPADELSDNAQGAGAQGGGVSTATIIAADELPTAAY